MAGNSFGDPKYGITKNIGKINMSEAQAKVEEALKNVGFGVLTQINLAETFMKKIEEKINPYIILGACNPKLAHEAVTYEAPIGLLLPCNVVIVQQEDGDVMVSAIDPVAMFKVVGRDEIEPMAQEVKKQLQDAIGSL